MDTDWRNAIINNDISAAQELLGRGANVDSLDRYGQTALMLAAHAGFGPIVEMLIAHRAKLDITAKFGLSALMLAVVAGHPHIARRLAEAGTDLSLRGTGANGFAGKTAHDLAMERGMSELAAVFAAYGREMAERAGRHEIARLLAMRGKRVR